jgi:hypothetical protein
MEISLTVSGTGERVFTLAVEVDHMNANCLGGLPRLSAQAVVRRTAAWGRVSQDTYPIITELHGYLSSEPAHDSFGAILLPSELLPLPMASQEIPFTLSLMFSMPRHYVKFLEEERLVKQSGGDMKLVVRLWGTVATRETLGALQGSTSRIGVVDFKGVHDETNGQSIRIPRSDWLDRILPGLGYGRSVLVELPLTRTPPIPARLKHAAESLESANLAFEDEDYRGALKYGRDVLDHLEQYSSTKQLTAFCREHLEPLVGETKSNTIDRGLNALRDVVNAGSHGNTFVADRAVAAYVIETLATQLRYISAIISE